MLNKDLNLGKNVYVVDNGIDYPSNPFQRLVKVEVEDSSKGRFQFDEHYPYLDDSFKFMWNRFTGWFVEWILVNLINRFGYGARIEGRKNIRKNRKLFKQGAMVVCNHVYQFDAVSVNTGVRPFRFIHIPMYAKHFNGKKWWYMVYCGGVPVPETIGGMKKFNEAFDEFHRRGDWTLIFPEAVRWDQYSPIRPFRKGAFTMAYKYNVPIIPCVLTWRPRKGIYRLFGAKDDPCPTLHIGEPVLPDRTHSRHDEVDRLRIVCHGKMVEMAGIENNPWPAIPEDDDE